MIRRDAWRAVRIHGSQFVIFARGKGSVQAHADVRVLSEQEKAEMAETVKAWEWMLG